jgi:AraC-like DNA-binding protein
MKEANSTAKSYLTQLLNELATTEGYSNSALDSVRFMRSNVYRPRSPVLYDPSIVIVAQGQKRGHLGDQSFTYDPHNYLVLSVPLPFECETIATPEEPMLAVSIRVDPTTIGELLLEIDEAHYHDVSPSAPQAVFATAMNDAMINAATRLLECLKTPSEARILGPQIIREITYRVLCDEQGESLRALMHQGSNFSKIAKSLRRIHVDYTNELDVTSLARDAGMSVSAFHQNFKSVTSTAPLQYIKTIRLHKARMLMVYDGLKANNAANQVGYESSSQFSREFKRLFGNSPADEAAQMRARLLPAAAAR